MKTWSAKQLQTFLDNTKGQRLNPLWHVMGLTGRRRGEDLGLKWVDVDLDCPNGTGAVLRVRQGLVSAGYKVSSRMFADWPLAASAEPSSQR